MARIKPRAKNRAGSLSAELIAMIAVLGSALLIVSYYKFFYKYCKSCPTCRGFNSPEKDDGGMMFQDPEVWQIFNHSYGLDESVIKSIPLFVFKKGEEDRGKFWDSGLECSVCLLEFKELEALRVLPKCSHAFHIDYIDVWLRSHANCPLCRANIAVNWNNNSYVGSFHFMPAMVARVRPNLEHGIADVVHDSFRSDEENNNRICDGGQRISTQGSTDVLQSIVVLHDEESANVQSNFEDLGAFGKPVLTRSYSFGCSGNEHYSGNALELLLMAEISSFASASSPWKRAFKRLQTWA